MTGDWVFWLGWIGAAVVYIVMIAIAWRALFGDRSRGKRRCPRCWHDLSHTPGMTCSECGFTATSEAQLHRTRRHKSVAALAIIACLGVAVFLNWQVDQRGWAGVVPTKALIWLLPVTIDDGGDVLVELERRMRLDTLSDREWLMLISRCAEGDPWREPVCDDWEATYGNVLRTWRGRLATNLAMKVDGEQKTGLLDGPAAQLSQSIDAMLLTIEPKVEATTRSHWPASIEPRVNVMLEDWWPADCVARMRITPVVDDAPSTLVYRASSYQPGVAFSLAVPTRPTPETPLELDVQVERRRGDDQPWEMVHEQRLTVQTTDAETDSGASLMAMEPVSDPQMDDVMQRVFGQGVVKWPSGPSPVRFQVNVPATSGSLFSGIAIGVKVELTCDGRLARRLNMWWLGGTPADRRYGFEIAYENLELLKALPNAGPFSANGDPAAASVWTLTVTGEEAIAHRAGPADSYWAGRVEAPLVVQPQRGSAPSRPWWTDEQLEEEAAGEYSQLD